VKLKIFLVSGGVDFYIGTLAKLVDAVAVLFYVNVRVSFEIGLSLDVCSHAWLFA
jgi:hypothetical protein